MAFEVAHELREIGGFEDGVKVIVEDDPGVDAESLVFAAVCQDWINRSQRFALVNTGSQATIVEVMK
jgi:hypothetical protein